MIRLILPATLLLSACAPADDRPPVGETVPADGPCDATPGQKFLGAIGDPAAVESIRIATGSRAARRIEPGMAVTMDYRQDRVNVELDEAGKIKAVRCG
ncbi:I78 family peptidase inhibitor [Sphingomonas sp. 1P06PA]|uniref:I78 family peptidase inhibitor n=1 Tax=Sphingomonas sp. 1P06PA TaxID=554121 RepID=UPI0039A5178D